MTLPKIAIQNTPFIALKEKTTCPIKRSEDVIIIAGLYD